MRADVSGPGPRISTSYLLFSCRLKKNPVIFPDLYQTSNTADGRDIRAVGSYMNCYLTLTLQCARENS